MGGVGLVDEPHPPGINKHEVLPCIDDNTTLVYIELEGLAYVSNLTSDSEDDSG
jgi:hypothetical protein